MRTITSLILLTLTLLAIGCQQQSRHAATQTAEAKPAASSWTHHTIRPTEYYLTGPQQARPPDGTFPKGFEMYRASFGSLACLGKPPAPACQRPRAALRQKQAREW